MYKPRRSKAFFGATLLASMLWHSGMLQAQSLESANEALFEKLERVHSLTPQQMQSLRAIFMSGRFIGQGNPAVAAHPATPQACEAKLNDSGIDYADPAFERICGARYMAPLYDPATQSPEQAQACIDQFEFPNIPCEYPVVWVRASEAAAICSAVGKRLCDAHEWEGGCAGNLQPPDYRFDLATGQAPSAAVKRMRRAHNKAHEANKRWSYGPTYTSAICAAGSRKSAGCDGGGWSKCGSNTYPTGYFPDCRSELGVYDINGNAAEHMNLPTNPAQMSSAGSTTLGYTEMKGSWFIFDSYRAHDDWCRWRAPFWHGTKVRSDHSHHNYHLGFRCCADVTSK